MNERGKTEAARAMRTITRKGGTKMELLEVIKLRNWLRGVERGGG